MNTFSEFTDFVGQLKNKQDLEDFLIGITTSKERAELTQRLEIVRRLIAGQPQHEIAKDLGVGVATITRGSKELAAGHFGFLKDKKNV